MRIDVRVVYGLGVVSFIGHDADADTACDAEVAR